MERQISQRVVACRSLLVALLVATLAALAAPGAVAGAQERSATADSVSASISGVVFDSLSMRGLAGAVVQVVLASDPSRARAVTAADDGSFRIDSVPTGVWVVGFYHAALDALGLSSSLVRVDVRAPGEIRVPLAIPSPSTIVSRMCRVDVAEDSTGLFLGYVRDGRGQALREKGGVRVQWSEVRVGNRGVERATPTIEAQVGEGGAFAMCGVPAGSPVLARAWTGSDSSGFVELDIPRAGLLRRDIFVGVSVPTEVSVMADSSASDSARVAATVSRGVGRVRGVVRRSDGRSIPGARLVFWGSGIETATNTEGHFAMRDLPTGTWTLETRAVGFLPVRQAIDVHPDRDVVTDVKMESLASVLDTVKVVTQRIYLSPQMVDFEQRRKSGFGYFMDEDAINRRNPIFAADLFRMAPGLSVMPSRGFGHSIVMRGRGMGGGYCVPAFFVDGMRMMVDDGNLDQVVNASEIRAVEVYSRASNVPPQFNTLTGCGSVVIHTGGRSQVTGRKR